jgi:quercetin dioxygenase-like cupin family protein
MNEATNDTSKFQIFRAVDALGLMEAGCMSIEPYSDVQRAGLDKLLEAGVLEGEEIRVLVNVPGFSLTHVWFKTGYPLPLHSHNADCLYYIIAGTIRLGTEDLGPRDSFLIPADVPYTYKAGPKGAEVLEFRHATQFNFLNLAKGAAFWDKAAETSAQNLEDWRKAVPPTRIQTV